MININMKYGKSSFNSKFTFVNKFINRNTKQTIKKILVPICVVEILTLVFIKMNVM